MDVVICSIFGISCGVIVLAYVCKFLNWIWFRPKKVEKFLRQQGFDGNSYRLFYGDLKEIDAMKTKAMSKPIKDFSNDIAPRLSPIYHNALAKNGEKWFVWLGPKPVAVILDPEIIRQVLSKTYDFPKPSARAFARLLSNGLSSLDTHKWAKHRKLINPAFHVDKLKHMVPSVYVSCGDMLSKWEDKINSSAANYGGGGGGSCEVDVWPYLETMTGDVISRTAFGSSYLEGRRIFQLQKELAHHVLEATLSVYIPGGRFLPTKGNRRINEITGEVQKSLLDIISRRMEAGEEASRDDLLGILLESNSKEIKQNGNESGMSLQEVMEECKLFYFAGQETTSCLLVWTMILLSKYQDWQVRARDEVLQLFGNTDKPDHQQLNHLRILGMILHEVLRLYPPAAELQRFTHEEIRVGKTMSLPAGVQLWLPLILLHHDCRIWGDDAKEFRPERFSDGVSKVAKAYFPFGWGPRICIGQNFAMLEAKMAMAMILQRYSFQLSPSYTHAPYKVITVQPQHGAHLILTKLQP